MSLSAALVSPITWCAPSSLPTTTTPATRLYATGVWPSSRVSERKASIRSKATFDTLDGWPNHVGMAISRMSEARMRSRICGHSSPSETASETTPKSIWWSARRITSVATPASRSSPRTTWAKDSEFDSSGERFSVQTRHVARIGSPVPMRQAASSCLRMPHSSLEPQRSTILPFSNRAICTPVTSIARPVGAIP